MRLLRHAVHAFWVIAARGVFFFGSSTWSLTRGASSGTGLDDVFVSRADCSLADGSGGVIGLDYLCRRVSMDLAHWLVRPLVDLN